MNTGCLAALRGHLARYRFFPLATGALLAARTPWGRYAKAFFFCVGVILPLGSIIWALLILHGTRIRSAPLPRVCRVGG